jgi:hypothetical protein
MPFNCLPHLIWVAVTIKLKLLQLMSVAYSSKACHGGERPNNPLDLRSCHGDKGNLGDVAAPDKQKLEGSEFFFFEGELIFGVRFVLKPEAAQAMKLANARIRRASSFK